MTPVRRPWIGLNCKLIPEGNDFYYKLDHLYVKAIERAGGVPVLLPFFRKTADARAFVSRVDGLLFTGGSDINPARWNEKRHPQARLLHPEKEKSDFLLARAALAADRPILGICLGMQLLNVAFGGSLHQHVVGHGEGRRHEVDVCNGRTRETVGRRPEVNSYHHQAVNRAGKGLRVTALSPDGLVEGIESDRHRWVVGVQWHPERILDQREQLRLFRSFIDACSSNSH